LRPPFPIVGVGASAGGVEALEGFFRGMPPDPGVALVIVTHLSPSRDSQLPEIIRRYTDMELHVAQDDTELQPNTVHVLPSDSVIGIEGGRLRVRPQFSAQRERKPIDYFFATLAADQGELAAAVVLSGGDGDGSLGVKAIKERGGLTLAQVHNGHGPGHPEMPQHAIATGLVDFAVPAGEMGNLLANFARSLREPGPLLSEKPDEEGGEQEANEVKAEIYTILRNRVGHDFSGYKTKTFLRRVQRRMQVTQFTSPAGYAEHLRQDPQEVSALFRDLLINVTSFFRDEEAFLSLATLVIPKLFERRSATDTVRVWVPGCSTGEEVFSIAMLLREHMDTLKDVPRVQIFATDIDERALSTARMARYPEPLLDAVSPERRARFFVPDGASYVVTKEVRELCIFSPHSIVRDPPFSRIDLVSCRNLLIYFGQQFQNQVVPLFHYALQPEGYLFLGTAENVSNYNDLFTPVDKRLRLFRSRSDAPMSSRLPLMVTALRAAQGLDPDARRHGPNNQALRQMAEGHVLERYTPPHIVVNQDGDIVYYSSRTGKYLEAPAGMPTRQAVTIARRGLRLDLRTLLREATETGRPVARASIAMETDEGHVQFVGLKIEPLNPLASGDPLFLILFIDEGSPLTHEDALRPALTPDGAAAHIERELRETRDRLQAMLEEYETALEELKSSNEELVSVNEEMQSTNEELEASKEELQSVNEELHTVNAELNGKVEALDNANSDLQNLFESTQVATVFLDSALVIRSFTPAVSRIFNILPTDRGRPITDLSSKFVLPGFADDIARVFVEQHPLERRAEQRDGSEHYLVRLAPYRDSSQTVRGVVVTFIDVTGLIHGEQRQLVLIAELQHRTRNMLAFVQSLASQSFEKGPSLDTYVTRLSALGRVQGLIGKREGDRVDLREIVELEIESLGAVAESRVTLKGGSVSLTHEHIQTLALALHELATNALKYGALMSERGHLEIDWHVALDTEGGETLVLHWLETGIATPPDTTKRGFGRQLIERALTHTMRARTKMQFGTDTVACSIEIPLLG
jgi:two-component system CheB/CheR fusion protein